MTLSPDFKFRAKKDKNKAEEPLLHTMENLELTKFDIFFFKLIYKFSSSYYV